jgi:hypothetical protein
LAVPGPGLYNTIDPKAPLPKDQMFYIRVKFKDNNPIQKFLESIPGPGSFDPKVDYPKSKPPSVSFHKKLKASKS